MVTPGVLAVSLIIVFPLTISAVSGFPLSVKNGSETSHPEECRFRTVFSFSVYYRVEK
jgi:hypothetical protein